MDVPGGNGNPEPNYRKDIAVYSTFCQNDLMNLMNLVELKSTVTKSFGGFQREESLATFSQDRFRNSSRQKRKVEVY